MRMEELRLEAELAARLRRATRAVALSGAGVSKESGLGTFRGAGGEIDLQPRVGKDHRAHVAAVGDQPRQPAEAVLELASRAGLLPDEAEGVLPAERPRCRKGLV